DLLGAQVLLYRDRIVGAALDGRIVGDDDALAPGDASDAGYHPGARDVPAVHAVRGELRELEEGTAGVEERPDALARAELAGRAVLLDRGLRAPARRAADFPAQILDQRAVEALVLPELLRMHVEAGRDSGHRGLPRLPVCPTIIRLRQRRRQAHEHPRVLRQRLSTRRLARGDPHAGTSLRLRADRAESRHDRTQRSINAH